MIVTEMTRRECREELAPGFGRLACVRDTQPYVVPIFFVLDDEYLYSFSTPGRKIEWMRSNHRVCLEIDRVKSWEDWTSVVALGRFEELLDTPDGGLERRHAHSLLQQRALWWQPAVNLGAHSGQPLQPVFFRIILENLTGRRGTAGSAEALPAVPREGPRRRWFWQLFKPPAPRQ